MNGKTKIRDTPFYTKRTRHANVNYFIEVALSHLKT